MNVLRALWLVRPDLYSDPGGDTTQIEQTREMLAEEGVEVTVCSERRPSLSGFDVVHLFHLDRLWENVPWCQAVRKRGVPAVLSPIYFPTEELDRRGRSGVQGFVAKAGGPRAYPTLRATLRAALATAADRDRSLLRPEAVSFARGSRFVLETAAVLLPNSEAERDVLERRFEVQRPGLVVPNGVDTETFEPPPEEREQEREGVLCVGRLVPRKNQLALIRALRGIGTPVRFVGNDGSLCRGYVRRCRREAGPEVEFEGLRDKRSLRHLYQSARVHVNVSWFETPGLASLEAAACGCALVVTPGGCTREYFRDEAYYCHPEDLPSIRRAVERALAAPPSAKLAERIRYEYPWNVAAQHTRKAYELALSQEPAAVPASP